ncbi:MAG: winged helix-turn-helix domain-containing protein [Acidobacteriota bacterium]|nr:winged helix-turn-helix domain-containing protein [Acidobacteriota bacterium]
MEPETPRPFGPYRLGDWTVQPAAHALTRDGRSVQVEPRLMKLLCLFAARAGEVIPRETIVAEIWEEQHVSAEGVSVALHELRKALGDDARNPRYIKTIRKAGFQLIAPVRQGVAEAEIAAEARTEEKPTATPEQAPPTSGKRRMHLLAVPVLAVLLVLAVRMAGISPGADAVAQPTIAVLPFATMSGESEQAFFAEGITEALINDLAQNTDIRVLPRRSVLRYADSTLGPRQLGKTLGVRQCVEGAVQVVGNRIMVTVQVLDTEEEQHLWAESYEKDIKDFFRIRREVALDLVRFFRGNEGGLRPNPSGRAPDVYYSYLKGRHYLDRRTVGDAHKAIGHFNLAVRKDPNYAEAHAGLAEAYTFFAGAVDLPLSETRNRAVKHVNRALALNDKLADAHLVRGVLALIHNWRWDEAEQHLQETLRLHPTHIRGRLWTGLLETARGRYDRAAGYLADAAGLDPASPETSFYLGFYHLLQNESDRAGVHLGHTVGLNPDHMDARLWRMQAARRADEDLSSVLSRRVAASPPYVADRLIALRNGLQNGTLPESFEGTSPVTLAAFYAEAGHRDIAADLLKRAGEMRDPLFIFARNLAFTRKLPDSTGLTGALPSP